MLLLSMEFVSVGLVVFAPRLEPLEATWRETVSEPAPTDVSITFSALGGMSDCSVLMAFEAFRLPGVLCLVKFYGKSSI